MYMYMCTYFVFITTKGVVSLLELKLYILYMYTYMYIHSPYAQQHEDMYLAGVVGGMVLDDLRHNQLQIKVEGMLD